MPKSKTQKGTGNTTWVLYIESYNTHELHGLLNHKGTVSFSENLLFRCIKYFWAKYFVCKNILALTLFVTYFDNNSRATDSNFFLSFILEDFLILSSEVFGLHYTRDRS